MTAFFIPLFSIVISPFQLVNTRRVFHEVIAVAWDMQITHLLDEDSLRFWSWRDFAARYENDISSLLPKCALDNFKRAFTLATSWENSGNEFTLTFAAEKTSTLAVDLISSEGRVFTSYAMSMSIIRTAGMA